MDVHGVLLCTVRQAVVTSLPVLLDRTPFDNVEYSASNEGSVKRRLEGDAARRPRASALRGGHP